MFLYERSLCFLRRGGRKSITEPFRICDEDPLLVATLKRGQWSLLSSLLLSPNRTLLTSGARRRLDGTASSILYRSRARDGECVVESMDEDISSKSHPHRATQMSSTPRQLFSFWVGELPQSLSRGLDWSFQTKYHEGTFPTRKL